MVTNAELYMCTGYKIICSVTDNSAIHVSILNFLLCEGRKPLQILENFMRFIYLEEAMKLLSNTFELYVTDMSIFNISVLLVCELHTQQISLSLSLAIFVV
jgi:hypothetical protein